MINIIDTFRNVIEDKYAVIKLLIMTVPVLICVYAYMANHQALTSFFSFIVYLIFMAIFFETVRRSCAAEPMLMPSFIFPLRILITFGQTLVAAIPAIFVCALMSFGYFQLLKAVPDIEQTPSSYYIITFIFIWLSVSLFFAIITQFLDSGKIFDSYNPKKVTKSLNTFIINTLMFVIQDAIFIGLVAVIPINVISVVAGFNFDNFFVYLYGSFFITLNFIMLADYVAQTKKEAEM